MTTPSVMRLRLPWACRPVEAPVTRAPFFLLCSHEDGEGRPDMRRIRLGVDGHDAVDLHVYVVFL